LHLGDGLTQCRVGDLEFRTVGLMFDLMPVSAGR
jgi:hypothetical protein